MFALHQNKRASKQWYEMSSDCVKNMENDNNCDATQNQSRFHVAKVSDETPNNENREHRESIFNGPKGPLTHQMSIDYSNTYYDSKNLKSLRYYTREALPRVDNYRNILSVHGHMTRPTLDELHGVQATINPDSRKASFMLINKTLDFDH